MPWHLLSVAKASSAARVLRGHTVRNTAVDFSQDGLDEEETGCLKMANTTSMVSIEAGRINYALQSYSCPYRDHSGCPSACRTAPPAGRPTHLQAGLCFTNSAPEPQGEKRWRICVGEEMKGSGGAGGGGSSFFYRRKCSSCPCTERVGPHGSPPSKGVGKTLFFLAGVLKVFIRPVDQRSISCG